MIEGMHRPSLNRRQLRHDFANDIGSLKLNMEALRLIRDDPAECEELLQIMQGTIHTLENRLSNVLDSLPMDDCVADERR